MKPYNKILIFCVSLLVLASCSKKKLGEYAPSYGSIDNLLTTESGYQNMLNGLYDEVRRYRSGNTYGDINNIMCMQAMIGTDNAFGDRRDGYMDIFNYWGTYNANSSSSQSHYYNVWKWLYETISSANVIINRAQDSKITWTGDEKSRVIAEARCIRAWCYRHLTYLWGDVPLSLQEINGSTVRYDWDRTPVAVVRDAMKEDLLFAEKNLPVIGKTDMNIIKGVAQHYLAELYLQLGKYDSAKIYALKVTTNPNYALVTARYGVNKSKPGTPFTDMFIEGNSKRSQGNTEALWVIQNELNIPGGDGANCMRRYWVQGYDGYVLKVGSKNYTPLVVSADYGGRGLGRMAATRWAINLYPAGDDRGSDFAWRKYYLVNQPDPTKLPPTGNGSKIGDTIWLNKTQRDSVGFYPDWPSTRKWDYANPTNVLDDRQYNDQVFLRAADTYLLLAEACYRLNDPQGAADAINALRNRAHAPAITSAQVTLDLILDERSRELFSEEDRRYVLLRTGTWFTRTKQNNIVVQTKSSIQLRDTLLPIPASVINGNISKPMPNNPGY